jgi:hypothetical protein
MKCRQWAIGNLEGSTPNGAFEALHILDRDTHAPSIVIPFRILLDNRAGSASKVGEPALISF